MDSPSFEAFADEMSKIAGLGDMWQQFLDLFRTEGGKAQRRVDYHFSPKAGKDKWEKLVRNVRDPKFVDQLAEHPESDETLIQHAKGMRDLSRGRTVAKIKSSRIPGKSYEVKQTGEYLACTCPDWRFKGSINPGYECKHIRAHKAGKVMAD